jgi:hypothetical protein
LPRAAHLATVKITSTYFRRSRRLPERQQSSVLAVVVGFSV